MSEKTTQPKPMGATNAQQKTDRNTEKLLSPLSLMRKFPLNTTRLSKIVLTIGIRNPEAEYNDIQKYVGLSAAGRSVFANFARDLIGDVSSGKEVSSRRKDPNAPPTSYPELTDKQRALVDIAARWPEEFRDASGQDVAAAAERFTGVSFSSAYLYTARSKTTTDLQTITEKHRENLADADDLPEKTELSPFNEEYGEKVYSASDPLRELLVAGLENTDTRLAPSALPETNLDIEYDENGNVASTMAESGYHVLATSYPVSDGDNYPTPDNAPQQSAEENPETDPETDPETETDPKTETETGDGHGSADADTGEETGSDESDADDAHADPESNGSETAGGGTDGASGGSDGNIRSESGNASYNGPATGLDTTSGRRTTTLAEVNSGPDTDTHPENAQDTGVTTDAAATGADDADADADADDDLTEKIDDDAKIVITGGDPKGAKSPSPSEKSAPCGPDGRPAHEVLSEIHQTIKVSYAIAESELMYGAESESAAARKAQAEALLDVIEPDDTDTDTETHR